MLLTIGFIDLVLTAVLHAKGKIVELNPLMRPLIEQSEWLFVVVKALTLIVAWGMLAWYAKKDKAFVGKICRIGATCYMVIWIGWFAISL